MIQQQQRRGERIQMQRSRLIVLFTTTFVLFILAGPVSAQRSWYRGDPAGTIKLLDKETDNFKKSLEKDLDHGPLNGSINEDRANEYVERFEDAVDKLKEKTEDQGSAPGLLRDVLERAKTINGFMRAYRIGGQAAQDWSRVKSLCNRLANSYYVNWRW